MLEPVRNYQDVMPYFERMASSRWACVGSLVPNGFPAYARIFHPAWRVDPERRTTLRRDDPERRTPLRRTDMARYAGIFHPAWRDDPERRTTLRRDDPERRTPLRWADMARHAGKTPHALMQWNKVSVSNMCGDVVEYPDEGRMPDEVIDPLRQILLHHSPQGAGCWLGAAREWGWDYRKSTPATAYIDTGSRAWDLFRAPVSMMDIKLFTNERQTANLIWCEDLSWWVATDIDLVSTYIGGSETLIQDILDSPELETWPAAPDDDVSFDADTVN